jgi:hypothetical protein
MLNPFREVNWNPDRAERRSFARSIAAGLPLVAGVLGGIAWMRTGHWPSWTLWLGGFGAAAGILLWIAPQIARPFYILWNGLGCCLGFVVSNAAVAAIFYLVVTPTGLLLRLFGRDPLERSREPARTTYWKDAAKPQDAERFCRQY